MKEMDMTADELAGLDWNTSEEAQAATRNAIRSTIGPDLSPLLMQNLQKNQWANAAEIIADIEPPRIMRFAPDLLEWLKDMNWPGADKIFEALLKLEKRDLIPELESAMLRAREQADNDWLESLLLLRGKMSD